MATATLQIASFGIATIQGATGMVAGNATLPAMGAAVTAGGGFRVVEFALRRGWAGLDFLSAADGHAGNPFAEAAPDETVTMLPDGATLRFREAVPAFS
jgi:hypothetical protein